MPAEEILGAEPTSAITEVAVGGEGLFQVAGGSRVVAGGVDRRSIGLVRPIWGYRRDVPVTPIRMGSLTWEDQQDE
jgi:hypothetical protein